MRKENVFDTKSVRISLLNNIKQACFALGRANSRKSYYEELLISFAMDELVEKDIGSENQFVELLGMSYMVRGIADNLRLFNDEPKETDFSEDEIIF